MTRFVTTLGAWILCTVTAFASPATDELTAALVEQIASQLAVARGRISLGPSELPELPGPLTQYRFEFGATPRGRTVVRGLSEAFRNVTFTIDVRLWDSAWVVTAPVERGEVLSPERFSRSWLDVTLAPVWSGREFSGLRAKRALRPGVLLTSDAVETVPLIARGRPVMVTAGSGHLRVSRAGVALSDARLGEPVRIRVDRQTIIAATATGPDQCAVGF